MSKPWPWSRRWFEVKVPAGASQEQVDDAVAQIQDAEKITHFQTSWERERDESKVQFPTWEEAYAISEDEKETPSIRTIAFFYAYHKHMNAGLTTQKFGGLGRFGNVDFYFIVRNPDYEGEGWRYKLTKLLRKWNLIEEFI